MVWTAALILAAAVPVASDEEKSAASKAYVGCLAVQARRLDDGTSDPISIGKVMLSLCDSEVSKVADVATRGVKRSGRVRAYMIEDMRADYTTAAIMVLQLRKQKAAQ